MRIAGRLVPAVLVAGALAPAAGAAPFSPEISSRLDTGHPVRAGGHPALVVTIRQDAGEETMRRSDVILPPQLQPEIRAAANTCSRARLAADDCPRRSRVGRASARTPLIDEPLQGPVYLVDAVEPPPGKTGLGLPSLVAKLSGGDLHLDLEAEQRHRATYRILTMFRGLPPVPVRRFRLRFHSSPRGPLVAVRDLCAKPLGLVYARFISHEGQERERFTRVRRPACRERPSLRVRMVNLLGAGSPRARLVVRRGPDGRAVRRAKIRLARLVAVPYANPWRGIDVHADGRRVPRRNWSLTRHERLRISTPGGADEIVVRLRAPAIRTSRRGARSFGDYRYTFGYFRTKLREVGGRTTRFQLRTRVRR